MTSNNDRALYDWEVLQSKRDKTRVTVRILPPIRTSGGPYVFKSFSPNKSVNRRFTWEAKKADRPAGLPTLRHSPSNASLPRKQKEESFIKRNCMIQQCLTTLHLSPASPT